jgi:hypothetical protein
VSCAHVKYRILTFRLGYDWIIVKDSNSGNTDSGFSKPAILVGIDLLGNTPCELICR